MGRIMAILTVTNEGKYIPEQTLTPFRSSNMEVRVSELNERSSQLYYNPT